MVKRVKDEFWLPEAMIQHIQSFMSGKEAAQTSILSKSWYTAWLTSPDLYFNQKDFNNCNELLQVSNKTLQRYVDSDLKIKSFKLWLGEWERDSHPLANELIQKAIEVGGTDFEFKLRLSSDSDKFVLPHAVLGSETLVKLSLDSCKIDYVKVNCRRLKSLSLWNILFEGNMMENVISSCRRLKSLSLWNILFKGNIMENIISNCPSIEDLNLCLCEISFDQENIRMPSLKSLCLAHVTISTLLFKDFSSKFHCLENLDVIWCIGYEEVRLCSHSLKFITFYEAPEGASTLKAIFDVPRLRKFLYSGKSFPSLTFENSYNWESDIKIYCPSILTSEWFLELKELLTKLKQSKVSLSLHMNSGFDSVVGEIEDSPKPVVENLILRTHSDHFPFSVYPALFDNLFWCFRPKFVTQYDEHSTDKLENISDEFLEDVYKSLNQHITLNCCTTTQSMLNQFDLEKADVEYHDKAVCGWRPLLGASFVEYESDKVRFHLRWGPKSATTQ